MNKKKRFSIYPYLYILPLVVLVGIVFVGSIVFNVTNGFYNWDGLTQKTFIGFQNYRRFYKSDVFGTILQNTLLLFVVGVGLHMLFGFIWAFLLKFSIFGKVGTILVRTMVFFPVVLAPSLIAYQFAKFFEPNFGAFNAILRALHLDFLCNTWTSDPKIAFWAIIGVVVWEWTGFDMLIYTSGLAGISDEIYESAVIDGAGKFTIMCRIAFPLLRSTHLTLTILGAIGALKMFDLTWILTKGGPSNLTEFFSTHIYKMGLEASRLGYASAVANVLFLIAFIVTLFQLKLYLKPKDA